MINTIIPDTTVQLFKSVPFLVNYKNTRWFNNISEQEAYFNTFLYQTISNNQYKREHGNTLYVNLGIEEARNINYIRFLNSGHMNKWFYAFVTEVRYQTKKTSLLIYEIDVIQTYMFDFSFKQTLVERCHAKEYDSSGVPIINREDENLDYGKEYDIIREVEFESNNILWLVMCFSDSFGVITQPQLFPYSLYCCFIPFNKKESSLSNFNVNGKETVSTMRALNRLFTSENIVGKCVSLYVTPFLGTSFSYSADNTITSEYLDVVNIPNLGNVVSIVSYSGNTSVTLPVNKYDVFSKPSKSKLLMYPYTMATLTNYQGQTFDFKLENILTDTIYLAVEALNLDTPKINYLLGSYNITEKSTKLCLDNGIIDNSTHDIPILTDQLASFLQSKRNVINQTIEYTYDNLRRQINMNNTRTNLGNIGDTLGILNTFSGVTGTTNQLASAGGGYANTMPLFNTTTNLAMSLPNNIYSRGSRNLLNTLTNDNLTKDAQQVEALALAKMNDISNVPATVSGQVGASLMNMVLRNTYPVIQFKQIKPYYQEKLSNYFHRFGYKVNEYMDSLPLNTRESFNYIKTVDSIITGNIPSDYILALQQIFDNGITLWHTNDLYNYNVPNNERSV